MALSEVTVLFGQRAGEIERARDYFTYETRRFVENVCGALARARSDPWSAPRVRLTLASGTEFEGKTTGYLRKQFAIARNQVSFKKRANFMQVAEVQYGVGCDETEGVFYWEVLFEPDARYQTLDDAVWAHWNRQVNARTDSEPIYPPGAHHAGQSNTVRLVRRPLAITLTEQVAFEDVKLVFDFLLGADAALLEGTGAVQDE